MPGAAEKAKGRSAENAIVEYLNRQLAVTVERRRLSGVNDKGDIAGLPGTVIEVKNQARMDLAGWVGEAERERQNAGAAFGVVWHKRKGKSDPGEWYVTMSGDTFCGLLDFVLPHLGGAPVKPRPDERDRATNRSRRTPPHPPASHVPRMETQRMTTHTHDEGDWHE